MRKTGLFLIVLMILTGCTTPRQMALFSSKISSMEAPPVPYFNIESNDILEIHITAIDSAAVKLYGTAGALFYVNNDGLINLPLLGKVKIAGRTSEEAIEYLTDLVRVQVQNPIITLSVVNATVTVLGEVRNPTRFSISRPISLPQAIGTVGGFTRNSKLKDVLVQRNEKGEIKKYHINLLNDDLFTSPCYYLQKGDVVDVQPLHAQ